MSNTHDTGGPAYPAMGTDMSGHGMIGHIPGMTLLDYFAGLAAWSISAHLTPADVIEQGNDISRASYSLASDMIAEKRRLEGGTC